jgi:hypothetical protein
MPHERCVAPQTSARAALPARLRVALQADSIGVTTFSRKFKVSSHILEYLPSSLDATEFFLFRNYI